MNNQFQKEEKELFNYFLKNNLFPKSMTGKYTRNKRHLELIVRPDCNQQCEYCYMYKYGHEMYEYNMNNKNILHNIDLILDYIFMQQKNVFDEIELFAGDLFYDGIFFDILDIFEKYFKILYKIDDELFTADETTIIIPSNLSFLYNNKKVEDKILEYQHRFKTEYNVRIMFSWSSDGLYCVDTREKALLPEDYFDYLIEFCKKSYSGIHPMVAASNIEHWAENYDWWLDLLKRHDRLLDDDFQPMMLEVRNDDWTPEAIEGYKKLLRRMMERRLELCNDSYEGLARNLLTRDGITEGISIKRLANYDPLRFFETGIPDSTADCLPCSIQDTIHFNCTNLSLVNCHRLAYPNLVAVYFKTDESNSHIIDFEPHNISAYIDIKGIKATMLPVCIGCDINTICMHGCLGANYEALSDPLLPPQTVCNFYHEIIKEKIRLYVEYDLFKYVTDEEVRQWLCQESWDTICKLKEEYINGEWR